MVGDCTLEDCSPFTIDVGDHAATQRGDDDDVRADDSLPAVTIERGPFTATTERGPFIVATEREPIAAATERGPFTPATEQGPFTAATERGPFTAATERGPFTAATERGPFTAAAERGPFTSATEQGPFTAATGHGQLTAAPLTKHFSASDVRRQKPFELPRLGPKHTARTADSFTTSASCVMERTSRNKPITSVRKLPDQRTEQKQPRTALTSRKKLSVTSVKRRDWQRGVTGAKRYTNNGKAKRDNGPVKLPAGQQPYLSDPTLPGVLPPDVSSLRWEGALDDPQDEADRLAVYKTNRRKRYLAAANIALDKYSATKRAASPVASSTSTSSPSDSVEAPRTLKAPRPADTPGLLPRIPGVDRLYPARIATPKLLVGCS